MVGYGSTEGVSAISSLALGGCWPKTRGLQDRHDSRPSFTTLSGAAGTRTTAVSVPAQLASAQKWSCGADMKTSRKPTFVHPQSPHLHAIQSDHPHLVSV